MFAGVRGAMVIAAGAIRFNFIKFVIADGLAAVVSGGMFIALGYWAGKKLGSLGEMRERIKGVEHWVFLGIGVVVMLIAVFVWIRRKRHRPPVTDIALERAAGRAERAAHRHARDDDGRAGPPGAGGSSAPQGEHSDADANGEMTDARK